LLELADCLADLQARMRWTPNKKLHVEMGIIKAVQILQHASLNDVISYLQNAAEGAEMPAVPIAGRAKGSGAASAAKPAPPAKVVQAATKEPVPAAEEKAAPAVDPVVEPPAEGAADAAEKQAGGRVSAGESAPPADAPKAENESPKAEQGPVEAGELWSRCVDYLQEKGDGMAGLVASLGKVLSFDESSLRVGFPESREFELHSIVAPLRAKMEKFISDHLGKGVHLKMELSAEVEDEEEEFFDEPPSFENEEEELEPVEAREPAKGKAKPKAKTDKAAEPDEFYNDPLIEEAMRLFEARIAKE